MLTPASTVSHLIFLTVIIVSDLTKSQYSNYVQMTQLKTLTSFDESPACAVGTAPYTSHNAERVSLCSSGCKILGRRTSTSFCVGFHYDETKGTCKLFSVNQRLYFAVQPACKFFLNVEVVGPNPSYAVCPASFTYNNQSNGCYKAINTTLNWSSAALYCQALVPGGHLVFINSLQEVVALSRTMPLYAGLGCSTYWIGLQCINPLSQSQLYWKLNSTAPVEPMNFTNWRSNEPSRGAERCVEMMSQGTYQWNDMGCNTLSCFFCEVDL